MMKAPVTYQGAKHRYASEIIDRIKPRFDEPFYDVCCGSGTVSIELLNRGFPAELLHMADSGPWGLVWEWVGTGHFDLGHFRKLLDAIPDRPQIQAYARELSKQPASIDTPYVFLILQACAFGGKAIWIEDGKWQNTSFRSFWQPNGVAKRKSTVNPMMPMPDTLYERMQALCLGMIGINGYCMDATDCWRHLRGVMYIDPPYEGTTGYGNTLDPVALCKEVSNPHLRCFVSEGKALSDNAVMLASAGERTRGGISGTRAKANEEWLSSFGSAA